MIITPVERALENQVLVALCRLHKQDLNSLIRFPSSEHLEQLSIVSFWKDRTITIKAINDNIGYYLVDPDPMVRRAAEIAYEYNKRLDTDTSELLGR